MPESGESNRGSKLERLRTLPTCTFNGSLEAILRLKVVSPGTQQVAVNAVHDRFPASLAGLLQNRQCLCDDVESGLEVAGVLQKLRKNREIVDLTVLEALFGTLLQSPLHHLDSSAFFTRHPVRPTEHHVSIVSPHLQPEFRARRNEFPRVAKNFRRLPTKLVHHSRAGLRLCETQWMGECFTKFHQRPGGNDRLVRIPGEPLVIRDVHLSAYSGVVVSVEVRALVMLVDIVKSQTLLDVLEARRVVAQIALGGPRRVMPLQQIDRIRELAAERDHLVRGATGRIKLATYLVVHP